jgi:ceramide glucosyltransferase
MGWGTWLAFKQFQNRREEEPSSLAPVSILKPLKGVDEGLFENLESFFKLNYPSYEILFSVTEKTEPAISVVQKLLSKYPSADAKLVCEPQNTGPNPKINNLMIK